MEVFRQTVAGNVLVGSYCALSNNGGLVSVGLSNSVFLFTFAVTLLNQKFWLIKCTIHINILLSILCYKSFKRSVSLCRNDYFLDKAVENKVCYPPGQNKYSDIYKCDHCMLQVEGNLNFFCRSIQEQLLKIKMSCHHYYKFLWWWVHALTYIYLKVQLCQC